MALNLGEEVKRLTSPCIEEVATGVATDVVDQSSDSLLHQSCKDQDKNQEQVKPFEHRHQHQHQHQTSASTDSSGNMDDIVTIKYLPLSLDLPRVSMGSTRTLPELPQGDSTPNKIAFNDDENNDVSRNTAATASTTTTSTTTTTNTTSTINNNSNNRETKVRIVEHIRKNLTLFESNREIYEVCPVYENRGHLQTLLNDKLQANNYNYNLNTNKSNLHNLNCAAEALANSIRASRSYSDQYTQYRASDLQNSLLRKHQDQRLSKPNSQPPHPSQHTHHHLVNTTTSQTHKQIPNRSITTSRGETTANSTLGRVRRNLHDTLPKIPPRDSNTLRRSVRSLNELIKKKIDLVRNRGHKSGTAHRTPPVSESIRHLTEQQVEEDLQYKAPPQPPIQTKFTTSQTLYLLPAPDYTVNIATKSVRDIILAHQRYKKNKKSSKSPNKFLSLIGTYTLRSKSSQRHQHQAGGSKSRRRTKSLILNKAQQQRTDFRLSSFRSQSRQSLEQPTLDHSVSCIKAKVKMPSGKSDKATIVDNKDGTVKISYEPKEVGQHEISLRYNDEPVDESPIVFYVDAVGAAKKKVTAYGSGLSRGFVGETCKFTINTGGLGSSKLNVTVDGPRKTQVSLNDNKDGTITVSYLPVLLGEYSVKISFDGKQVVGSPFTTTIGGEGRQRSYVNVGRGSEHTLDLKISEEDLKSLYANIVTPCGLEEPCGLKLLASGQLAIVFTPREQGEHSVSVKRMGNHIGGSPFKFEVMSRDIGDAKQVKVSGKGLKEGKTNTPNEIIINTKEAGFGGLSVALEGPGKSEITSKEVLDGTIKLNYTPYEPGQYNLIVKYADHVVLGSPFSINVTGQGTNPQKENLRKFRKLISQVDVNSECRFTFKMPGVSAYDLSARVHSPQGKAEDASIKDQGDFIYLVTFTPKEVGLYSLSIRCKEIHVIGSPFPFTVGPMQDMGAHRVRCSGSGLVKGVAGKLNEFNVFTREAGAGELNVTVEGPSKPELTYTDRKDGSCHIGYKVSAPGEYRISVLFNDHEVPDSPFCTNVMPSTGEVSKIELGPMPPENMIQLNKPCNMTVIMNGAKGNIEGKVKLPSGKIEDCFASPIDAENWGVRFIPRELGIHQVHIKFNKGASHIPQSPILIRVGHDNADPASVLAHGNGLKSAIVNHASDFIVETCNAGRALLEVNIEGPSKASMGCAEIDEGYKINYTPLAPGDYFIAIKYNGSHVGGSPFKVNAVKQPGSRTVADVGSQELSTLSISTTEREAKQKVEQMPKFKSDASRVYCKGMGLKKAFAGKPNTLTVNCSEAGFNMMYASFIGPTRNTIYECSVKHMGGSIYEIKYVCKDKGDAVLLIKYGDEQIPGSPFRLDVV